MAYSRKSSFAAGELDPALHERTTLDKYQSGLATLRNAHIGKTGRVVSRAGTVFLKKPKYDDKNCIIVSPPYDPYLIEWGDQYVRIHDVTYDQGAPALTAFSEDTHDWLESDLPKVQFEFSGRFAYIFCEGKEMKKMVVGPLDPFNVFLDTRFQTNLEIYNLPPAKTVTNWAYSTGAGNYPVDYIMTYVINGQESLPSGVLSMGRIPLIAGESNVSRLIYGPTGTLPLPTEVKVYRRPQAGGAFGYIGSASTNSIASGNVVYDFVDYGGGADYTHAPPTVDFSPLSAKPKTGMIYQQRLIINDSTDKEAIYASRPGFQNNFTRDYPLDSDSALQFKSGTTGNARVLRFLDSNGLTVFTTAGIYANDPGALTPENIAMNSKGNWVIEDRVPPLKIPGGVLFVDKLTNTIRSLIFSNEAGGYPGEEVSIFSNHLFLNKNVISWTFQDGDIPLVWIVFDDGSLISLTYQREHQMQAWSRHDSSNGLFECCTTVKDLSAKSQTFFVVKRGSVRTIECTTHRFTPDIKEFIGMDSSVVFDQTMNAALGGVIFDITPNNPDDWTGPLTVTCNYMALSMTPGNGQVGTTWRFFDKDGSAVDLVVTTFLSANQVIVQPSVEFPFDQALNVTLYSVATTLGGLGHLEGQLVSVMVDGYVISSPNNDIENYADITVVGGAVTLPNGLKGAFIRIGVPFTSDVETLDVDTVEQKPTLLESKIVSRVFVKVYRTRGLYIGSKFSANDALTDGSDADYRMEDPETLNDNDDFIGNAAQALITKRYELPIPNDWKSSGRICIRQVDPLPYEILSIIPDLSLP